MVGKYLIIIGLVIAAVGLVFTFVPKAAFLGRLPGDIYYKRDNLVLYLPLASSILVSIVLSFIFYLISRR